MKKLLAIILAAAFVAGCANDEVVDAPKEAIAFGDTFVDDASRADYSNSEVVKAFKVYGVVSKGSAKAEQIFNAATVTSPNGLATDYHNIWSCDVTEYWAPNANYKFAAIVDGEVASQAEGLPATISFEVADGASNKDLLYAETHVSTNASATPISGPLVAFVFEHLLSRMQFVVENTNATVGDKDSNGYEDGYTYQVTDITVTGVAQNGLFTVEETEVEGHKYYGTWAKSGSATTSLSFGSTEVVVGGTPNAKRANETRQFLPVEQELEVVVTFDTYLNGVLISEGVVMSESIESRKYDTNKVYNVKITLCSYSSGPVMVLDLGTSGGWTL